jgi:hypothetical protein
MALHDYDVRFECSKCLQSNRPSAHHERCTLHLLEDKHGIDAVVANMHESYLMEPERAAQKNQVMNLMSTVGQYLLSRNSSQEKNDGKLQPRLGSFPNTSANKLRSE